ncbi:Gti1/Pac2 family-domain-containing protein [Cyathus striatus]|nr:Gti1/Pac2 family-domain-containing protein [Cyathus striatus]
MSAAHQANNQQPPTTWTEPPWSGWIETTGDALLILEAARRGLIPRVTRRLVDSERKMITSGSVFVFDEDESGIKRWTDGFFWSPSRILGNFLLYRETDKRGAGHRGGRSDAEANEQSTYNMEGVKVEGQSLSRPKSEHTIGVDKHRERTLMGSLTNSYKFKPDGLMKKTFSLTIGGVAQHLISYYKIEDVENGRLRAPSTLPELASLEISPEYLDKTHFRNPPKVEIGADGIPRYRGEADDIDTSPALIPGPLTGLPLLTDGRVAEGNSNKRGKRYDPYAPPAISKRPRKNTKSQPSPEAQQAAESSGNSGSISPPMVAASMSPVVPAANPSTPPIPPPSQPYADPNMSMVSPSTPYPTPFGVPGYYPPVPGYGVPAPLPYPPPQGAYPHGGTSSSASPQHPPQQPMVPHNAQYSYAGYPPPPQSAPDPSQGAPQAHFYSYYPPPPPPPSHGPYPSPYPGVAWPHYASYPPQPHPIAQHPPPPPPPTSSGDEDKTTQVEAHTGPG